MWLKATNVRLTALSMSSMDMKTVMTLRLMRNAAMPMQKSTAASTRYQAMGTTLDVLLAVFLLGGDGERAGEDEGEDQKGEAGDDEAAGGRSKAGVGEGEVLHG